MLEGTFSQTESYSLKTVFTEPQAEASAEASPHAIQSQC